MGCPIDTRRALYQNIVLSGGSTMFKDFGRRLQRDIDHRVKKRIKMNMAKHPNFKGKVRCRKVCISSELVQLLFCFISY